MQSEATQKLRAVGPIRVTIPAKIAYKPDALKKSIASVLERIGCPKCFSGADCLFQTERNIIFDDALRTVPDTAPAGPHPDPWKVSVGLSNKVKYDIDKVFVAVDRVIDILGPHPCISGFDVLFQDELRTIVVNEQLQAQRFDARF